MDINAEINSNIIIVRHFKTPLTSMIIQAEHNKEIIPLDSIIDQIDLIGINISSLNCRLHIFLNSAWNIF